MTERHRFDSRGDNDHQQELQMASKASCVRESPRTLIALQQTLRSLAKNPEPLKVCRTELLSPMWTLQDVSMTCQSLAGFLYKVMPRSIHHCPRRLSTRNLTHVCVAS